MILKSYIVEENIEILKNYQGTLIYGENSGIKNDIKQALREKKEDAEIITFFEEEILKNKNILHHNVINESLFSEKKIIFILGATDKIYQEIQECIDKENKNIKIYIFSGNLEKKSKLKNLFEKNAQLAMFACYQDNDRTLINYINRELKGFSGLTGEIVNLIITNSNMSRRIILSEISKIKTYFLEKKLNKKDVLEILNIKSNTTFDEIRDSALNGEKQKINKLLSEVELINEDAFFYLNSLNYRVVRLQEIIKISNNNKNNYEQSLQSIKPPIFWKDKPVVMRQLEKWNPKKLALLHEKIGETEILLKKNSHLHKDIIIKQLIMNLVNRASSSYA